MRLLLSVEDMVRQKYQLFCRSLLGDKMLEYSPGGWHWRNHIELPMDTQKMGKKYKRWNFLVDTIVFNFSYERMKKRIFW